MDEESDSTGATAESRSAATDALWTDVRVQPIEIALPSGVGYTLRAYRLSTEVRAPEIDEREEDFPEASVSPTATDEDGEDVGGIDEAELTAQALAAGKESGRHTTGDGEAETDGHDASAADKADAGRDDEESLDAGEGEEAAEGEEEAEPEDVPVFLAERGRLLLFRSPEGLVEYVRTSTDHELAQLDTWDELRERIEPDDIVPLEEDRYELDLVVENLRGGHDAWDPSLIIQAGELARDVAYALRIPSVMTALAPGSPLDDLDEGLRTVEAGGFGAFFARRRLRKIDPQTTAALSWRTVIGKISSVVDWRD
ncbi:DNA primase [Planosporangium thailandense]|uniref:DNA primase n=1 Tax=Planosporangium thailandense TaxID=765197 RepID=A0ABX0XVS2_9ACTN|nr:DNA primase [Planosporangium thailandense]NJC69460.1 DNA primase [Planosporangium thailandense]